MPASKPTLVLIFPHVKGLIALDMVNAEFHTAALLTVFVRRDTVIKGWAAVCRKTEKAVIDIATWTAGVGNTRYRKETH